MVAEVTLEAEKHRAALARLTQPHALQVAMAAIRELQGIGASAVKVSERGDIEVAFARIADAQADGTEIEQLRQDNHRLANELEMQREARRVERGDY